MHPLKSHKSNGLVPKAMRNLLLMLLVTGALSPACYAQIANVEATTEVVDAIVRHLNANSFDSVFDLGTERAKAQSNAASLSRFLSKQIKPFGNIISTELLEDLGEMKYFRLDFDDGEKKRSLLLNIGVDGSKHYYALGFRNMPAEYSARETKVKSDNLKTSEIDLAVDSAAMRFMKNPAMVGVSIGIIHDGKLHAYNYGETAAGNGTLPTADSFYEIGSITKTFTGILLAQAVLDKKLSLEDDVRLHLEGSYPNLAFDGNPILLRHLSTHTSGLPSVTDHLEDSDNSPDPWGDYSQAKLLDGLQRVTVKFKPGSSIEYSNIGVGLLGIVLERVYGASFVELVNRSIAQPAGMKDTKIVLSELESQRFVVGHNEKGKPTSYWHIRGAESAGALRSTGNDMLKYMKWNIEESNPAVQMSHATQWTGASSQMGLGWIVRETALGYRHLNHDGGTGGFHTSCNVYPSLGIGILVMTNNGNSSSGQLATEIFYRMTKSRH